MKNKVLFLTLRVFSATGGIEKVCRIAGKALYELGLQYGGLVKIYSMYGKQNDADTNNYFPQLIFKGFNDNKISYVVKAIGEGRKSKVVLMSHINLLIVGYLIKLFKPSVNLILLAHGIEVWKPLSSWKKFILRKCDLILPVSHFTQQKMQLLHGLPESKFTVVNNCLDPFLELSTESGKSNHLLQRYGLNKNDKILLTVSRMADTEQYKGYDKVIEALPELIHVYSNLRYLLVGKYDEKEKKRLDLIINQLRLQESVIFTGIVSDKELAAHFKLADVFIMPSEKEGFGIVFIEAMNYGIPVIAGNIDGSVDALKGGELGILVNPKDNKEIVVAIDKILSNPNLYIPIQEKLQKYFGYPTYKKKIKEVIG